MQVTSDAFGSCQSGGFGTSEWSWIVGCGEIDFPGCTDPEAINFIPVATVDDGSCILPAENDLICDATPINCGESLAGTTLGTTLDNVGTCGTTNTAPGAWYVLTPDIDAIASFSTCSQADFDTKISVFSADACDGLLTCVGGQDDNFTCTGNTTLLENIDIFSGTNYYILVHGFDDQQGTFTLSIECEEVTLDCPGL